MVTSGTPESIAGEEGCATAFWRALTRDCLSEAEELLLAMPPTVGPAFTFREESGGDDTSGEGESASSPTSKHWSLEKLVSLHRLDVGVDCLGVVGPRPREGEAGRFCIDPAGGADGCDKMVHRQTKATELVDGLVIECPRSSPATRPTAFTMPCIPVTEFPREFTPERLTILMGMQATAGRWRTALSYFPSKARLARFTLEEVETQPKEEETPGDEPEGGTTQEEDTVSLKFDMARALGKIRSLEETVRATTVSRFIEMGEEPGIDHEVLSATVNQAVRDELSRRATLPGESADRDASRLAVESDRLVRLITEQEERIGSLETEIGSPGGRLGLALAECRRIEARTDLESVEMGGEIYRSEDDVNALLVTLPGEAYSCVMDFVSVLFFASDPYADYEGVMAAENARLKAGYKSTRAARMMASHQIKYPPILTSTLRGQPTPGQAGPPREVGVQCLVTIACWSGSLG